MNLDTGELKKSPAARVQYLDGLRGIAILLVLGYHTYSRWPELMPYKSSYEKIPFFTFGWLGVYLFFLISGFVILLTLDKCRDTRDFLYRRWLRLFPSMLICSVIIFSSAFFFTARPMGKVEWIQLIPGLTFIDHKWINRIFQTDIMPLEGTFWSLFVEFKFYVFASLVYFNLGRNKLIPFLTLCYAVYISFLMFDKTVHTVLSHSLFIFIKDLSFGYFGWFASGALVYEYFRKKQLHFLYYSFFIAAAASFTPRDFSPKAAPIVFCMYIIFVAPLFVNKIRNILTFKPILFWGFISYPFYLLHENALISATIQLGMYSSVTKGLFFLPLIPIAMIAFVAWIVSSRLEPRLNEIIDKIITANKWGKA